MRARGVAAQLREHVGHAGPGLGQLPVLFAAGTVTEEVAVETDGDVIGLDLDLVVPESVPDGWQPSSLELIGTPQLVESSMDDDDACHARQPVRCAVSL
jgi:hypothetical protein